MNSQFVITYNPNFNEYHAIRISSGCSVYCNSSKLNVKQWIASHGQPIQLNLFDL